MPVLLQNKALFFDAPTQPLVAAFVQAIAVLPLHTPCCVALFRRMAIDQPTLVPQVIRATSKVFATHLDRLLLADPPNVPSPHTTTTSTAPATTTVVDPALSFLHCRLILRFWVLLSTSTESVAAESGITTKTGTNHNNNPILPWVTENDKDDEDDDESETDSDTPHGSSVSKLLRHLVKAAVDARGEKERSVGPNPYSRPHLATLLAHLVGSVIPYLVRDPSDPNGGVNEQRKKRNMWVSERLVTYLDVCFGYGLGDYDEGTTYLSPYAPGLGPAALLLLHEPLEGEDSPDEVEEEEEEEDGVTAGQVCDHWQDQWRCMRRLVGSDAAYKDDITPLVRWPTQCALLYDRPWDALVQGAAAKATAAPEPTSAPTSGEACGTDEAMPDAGDDGTTEAAAETSPSTSGPPLSYSGESVLLDVVSQCRSLACLIGGESHTLAPARPAAGLIMGRLPIFGPPPELREPDDDEEEAEDEGQQAMDEVEGGSGSKAKPNPRWEAYQNLGMVDRHLLGEAIRDIVISHESVVTESGVERGTTKAVAEQVWAVGSMLIDGSGATTDPGQGIEYCIIETLLSLILQADNPGSSPFRVTYLSRVVLEFTRLAPTIASPALAVAVQTLFNDYLPTLVPAARHNAAKWLAYHLVNTDFQWPEAYWRHWEPFALQGWGNSRGTFLRATLALMAENLSHPERLVHECLPKGSSLTTAVVATSPDSGPFQSDAAEALRSLESDVQRRVWGNAENPGEKVGENAGMLLSYLCGDEVAESVHTALEAEAGTKAQSWWRTCVTSRALFAPARQEGDKLRQAIEEARSALAAGDERAKLGDDADDSAPDTLSSLLDSLGEYHALLVGVLTKDAQNSPMEAENLEMGEIVLVEQLDSSCSHSRALFEGCLQALLRLGVVRPASVLRWSLGDRGNDDTVPTLAPRWWEIASMAIRFGMKPATEEESSRMEGEEDSDSVFAARIKALLDPIEPLVAYAVRRACQLLIRADSGSNKLSPIQVDLIEGSKALALLCRIELYDAMETPVGIPSDKIEDALAESWMAGKSLASLCSGDTVGSGAYSIDLMMRMLQRLDTDYTE